MTVPWVETTIQKFGNEQIMIILSKRMEHGFEKGDKIRIEQKGNKLIVTKV